jgi:DUF1680 family protein
MAGLRAMQIVRNDYFAETSNAGVKINLYLDTDYSDDRVAFSFLKGKMFGDFHSYELRFEKVADPNLPISIRKPSWADDTEILLNGKIIKFRTENGYFVPESRLTSGDVLQIRMKYRTKIISGNNTCIKLEDVKQPVFGVLCYGPYVMGVDTKADIVFSSEPNNNTVFVETITNGASNKALSGITANSFVYDAYLTANYKHDGFPSYYQTVFFFFF